MVGKYQLTASAWCSNAVCTSELYTYTYVPVHIIYVHVCTYYLHGRSAIFLTLISSLGRLMSATTKNWKPLVIKANPALPSIVWKNLHSDTRCSRTSYTCACVYTYVHIFLWSHWILFNMFIMQLVSVTKSLTGFELTPSTIPHSSATRHPVAQW